MTEIGNGSRGIGGKNSGILLTDYIIGRGNTDSTSDAPPRSPCHPPYNSRFNAPASPGTGCAAIPFAGC